MKAKILNILVLALAGSSLFAQSITPQVINSTGGTSQKGYYFIDWSIGELTLVNQMQTSGYIVTNGFIQPFTHDPNLKNNEDIFADGEIRILPNPTRDILEIDFKTKQQGRVTMSLVNVSGNILYQREITSYGHGQIERIDMTRFANGSYFLTIKLNPLIGFTKKSGTYKIVKLK